MSNASQSNIEALALVIRASLAELRHCAEGLSRDAKIALPRLIDEASVLSGALQRLDRALEAAPAASGLPHAKNTVKCVDTAPGVETDPHFAKKWQLALDRAYRLGAGRQCAACEGVT